MVSMKKLLDELVILSEQSPSYTFFKARKVNYAMNMYQLQSMAKLTFKEADAFLGLYYDYWRSADFNVPSDNSIYSLRRRAKKKIATSGHTAEEIFDEYFPKEEYAQLYF
jgi:hypothetical protein